MNIKKYNEIADKNKPQKQVLKHTASAFLVGGVIGMIGEFFLNLYKELFSFSEKEATPIMLITLILIAAILTGLGIYDRLGDFAGAGSFIPITGFSNAMTSSAMEARSEGFEVELDSRDEKLGYRIREAQMQKANYILVLGNNERDERTVTYRKHGEQKATTVTIDEFVSMLKQQIKDKK